MKDARDNLQQRAFAGAVLADDAESFAALNLEADVIKCREVVMERDTIQTEQFFEASAWGRVDRIVLGNPTELDDRLRH